MLAWSVCLLTARLPPSRSIVESTNPELKGTIVRVNVFRAHRQTIQYIQPTDAALLSQAELLVIDEAAAIPLPQVGAWRRTCRNHAGG